MTEKNPMGEIKRQHKSARAIFLCWRHYIEENHPGDISDCPDCKDDWSQLRKEP